MSLVSASFWHSDGTTSLEGFECGGAEQHVRRSDHVTTCPSVTVNPFGSPSDWARNGHDVVYGLRSLRYESSAADLCSPGLRNEPSIL
jgi:hypothetical protein